MLARGALCRLAADVPTTSARDIPQLARLVQRTLHTRRAFAVPVLSRAYKNVLIQHGRSYATTTAETKPTKTVKKAVKAKAAAKKTPAKKPAAAKKKAPVKKKAPAAKKKPAARKPALTPEQKLKAQIKDLKTKILTPPSTTRSLSARDVWTQDFYKSSGDSTLFFQGRAKLDEQFASLTPAEREVSFYSSLECV